eukprot:gene32207-16759_t
MVTITDELHWCILDEMPLGRISAEACPLSAITDESVPLCYTDDEHATGAITDDELPGAITDDEMQMARCITDDEQPVHHEMSIAPGVSMMMRCPWYHYESCPGVSDDGMPWCTTDEEMAPCAIMMMSMPLELITDDE